MILHKDLTGIDLHKTKISIALPNRVPEYIGEVIFDGETLWVGTGSTLDSWKTTKSTPPPLFSWVVNLAAYTIPQNFSPVDVTLYYADCLASDVDTYASSFSIVKSWQFGIDARADGPIDLTPFIQANGKGSYTVLISGSDGYGAENMPAPSQRLRLVSSTSLDALEMFSMTVDFAGKAGIFYSGVTGFYLAQPLAQVLLEVGQ